MFLGYNASLFLHEPLTEFAKIFYHGLVMDAATAAYLTAIPALLIIGCFVFTKSAVDRLVNGYTLIIILSVNALLLLDLGLFPHWGTRVNVTAFNYFDDPVAMKASISLVEVGLGVFLLAILTYLLYELYAKLFLSKGFAPVEKPNWTLLPTLLCLLAALVIGMRGGLDTSPLNHSSVTFSQKLLLNQAATNHVWNFAKSVEKKEKLHNPCKYMTANESVQAFSMFMASDTVTTSPRLLNLQPGQTPNVVLIVLESFSNKVVGSLGGRADVATQLDEISKSSTVFTSFYASGNRSDRGMSALLGGYPSLLGTSIMMYPEKSDKLDLLSEYFEEHNYHTSFYYGGDINFYNLRNFVVQGKYDQIISKEDFPADLGRMSKWGVPDGYLFQKALVDIALEQEPFMKTIYTVSSHPPYDVPYAKFKGLTIEDKYINAVAYTDSCLGVFIDGLKKLPSWSNTLVIITADHGALQPGPTDITSPETYKIPLIWTGGVVDSTYRVETITMQSDLGETLIHQLGWASHPSKFSKDFFVNIPFAFYMLDYGWGFVTADGNYFFDRNVGAFTSTPSNSNTELLKFAKAYMQVLHEDFKLR